MKLQERKKKYSDSPNNRNWILQTAKNHCEMNLGNGWHEILSIFEEVALEVRSRVWVGADIKIAEEHIFTARDQKAGRSNARGEGCVTLKDWKEDGLLCGFEGCLWERNFPELGAACLSVLARASWCISGVLHCGPTWILFLFINT